MMIKKSIVFSAILLIIIALFGCERCNREKEFGKKPPHFPPGFGKEGKHRIENLAKDLDLSEEQVDSLMKIHQEIIKKHKEIKEEEKQDETSIKHRIIGLIRKDSLKEEEVLSFLKDLQEIKGRHRDELDNFIAKRIARAHSILTKKQREKMIEKLEKFDPGKIKK
jgi:Spy/CpxP family protein refolding chaperone